MVEIAPIIIFFVILFSVPLQIYLSPRSTTDIKYYLNRIVEDIKSRYFALTESTDNFVVDETTIQDLLNPDSSSKAKDNVDANKKGYFGGSTTPRDPRPPHIKFRVGQIIKHRLHKYRGVIIGWDEEARAPEWWFKRAHKNRKDLKEQPNYTILIDTRDRLNPQIGYVAEENIMLAENSIIHPLIKHYFETFDSNKNYYNSRPWHRKIYPNDLLRNF